MIVAELLFIILFTFTLNARINEDEETWYYAISGRPNFGLSLRWSYQGRFQEDHSLRGYEERSRQDRRRYQKQDVRRL